MMPAAPDVIEQACARLVALYGYLNDARDVDALAALFTVDAILYRPAAPAQAVVGRDAIRASFAGRPPGATFHLCTDVVIDVEDAEHATGRSRILLLKEGATAPLPGIFQDRFRLTGEGWKFSERRGALWLPA
jgi:hypothetical protein